MMIGRSNPTVQIPYLDDPTSHIHSHSPLDYSLYEKAFSFEYEDGNNDFDIPVDAFSCDNFRMFDFKVKKCTRARSHDWVECPFAHPGEKARRRDPRRFHYSGTACPDFRKGLCRRGDACEFSHGVFECWLHPARYRTLPCKDGTHCRRRICFFAHTPEQLRVLSPDSSPSRLGIESGVFGYGCSPPSSPTTPLSMAGFSRESVSRLSELTRGLRIGGIGDMGMSMSVSPPGWMVGSPRSPVRSGFMSLPTTPFLTRSGLSEFDSFEEEPVMERVESGRNLRERIYAKIGKENSLERVGRVGLEPDVGWVMDLVN